jgi:hypothetical protein
LGHREIRSRYALQPHREIKADNQTRTAADLRNALINIRADVHTNLSQVGTNPTLLAGWDGPRDVEVVIVDLREHGVVALR